MISSMEKTKACQFCGARLLTIWGMDDENLQDLPVVCSCDQAVLYLAQMESQAQEQSRELHSREALKRFSLSNMPKAWETYSMKSYQHLSESHRNAYCLAEKYIQRVQANTAGNMIIAGPVGVGKSYLAACIMRDLHCLGMNALWVNMGDVLRELRESFGNKNKSMESAIINKYSRVRVLCIDDLGKEKPTEWALSILFNLVNERHAHGRPIIVTTNYGSSSLIDRLTPRADYGEERDRTTAQAVIDRLTDGCVLVKLKGQSCRKGVQDDFR